MGYFGAMHLVALWPFSSFSAAHHFGSDRRHRDIGWPAAGWTRSQVTLNGPSEGRGAKRQSPRHSRHSPEGKQFAELADALCDLMEDVQFDAKQRKIYRPDGQLLRSRSVRSTHPEAVSRLPK